MSEKLREALQELVRLKRLKDAGFGSHDTEAEDEYERCKPLAWAAAEAALMQEAPASRPAPIPLEPVAPDAIMAMWHEAFLNSSDSEGQAMLFAAQLHTLYTAAPISAQPPSADAVDAARIKLLAVPLEPVAPTRLTVDQCVALVLLDYPFLRGVANSGLVEFAKRVVALHTFPAAPSAQPPSADAVDAERK